jgi:cytochrome c oxidase assembly protein subunit 15
MSEKFLRWHRGLLVAVLSLIALGGSVRAMNAGLSCPDWPLCFGTIIPDYHPQVYFEFIHRVMAGLVAMAVVASNVIILRSPQSTPGVKRLCWLVFAALVLQVMMGGLTVLLQLKAGVVATHLVLGMSLLSGLLLIHLNLRTELPMASRLGSWWLCSALALTVLVCGQIFLGALVASHYAATACPDFPLCNGQWVPTLKGPMGLHVLHRLGAYLVFVSAFVFSLMSQWKVKDLTFRKWAQRLGLLVMAQFVVGISNVLFRIPPLITVIHLVLGAMILATCLRLVYRLWKTQPAGQAIRSKDYRMPITRPSSG